MNLTDFEVTPPHIVYAEVERMCAEHGVEIEESEVIGLIPAKAVELAAAAHLKLKDFEPRFIIENRIRDRGPTH
jgi:glutamate formiminotransferase